MVGSPLVSEVFGAERRLAAKNLGFAVAKLPGADETPNRDAGANDTCFSAADCGVLIHTGEAIAEFVRNRL